MDKITPEILLGLLNIKRGKDDTYTYVRTLRQTDRCRMCVPGIVSETDISKTDKPRILFPFYDSRGQWPRQYKRIRQSDIVRMQAQPDIANMMMSSINRFSVKVFQAMVARTKELGVTAFVMNPKIGVDFLKGLGRVIELYKYHTVHAKKTRDYRDYMREAEMAPLPVLTMFDLEFCVPVFNRRRADGVGFHYELILPNSSAKKGEAVPFGCLSMILCQHRDNVFRIDGVKVRDEKHLTGGAISDLVHLTKSDIAPKDGKLKKKIEARRSNVDEYIMFDSTSTSTGYYRY